MTTITIVDESTVGEKHAWSLAYPEWVSSQIYE